MKLRLQRQMALAVTALALASATALSLANATVVTQTFTVDPLESHASIDSNGDPFNIGSVRINAVTVNPFLGELVRVTIDNNFTVTRDSGAGPATIRLRYFLSPRDGHPGIFGHDLTVPDSVLQYSLTDTLDITPKYAGYFTTWNMWQQSGPNQSLQFYADVYSHTSIPSITGVSTLSYFYDNKNTVPSPVPEPETYALVLAGLGLMAGLARPYSKQKTAN
jgi:hypothetical protein